MEYNQTPEVPPMNYRIFATCAGLILISASAQAAGSPLSAGPLFTKGNQIVDGGVVPQRLACIDWNGGNHVKPGLSGLDLHATARPVRPPRIPAPPRQPGERLEAPQKPADVPAETLR